MGLDSSIAMGYQPIKLDNPMNSLAQLMQLDQAKNQNKLAELQFQQHQQAQNDTNSLNALYAGAMGADGKIDRAKLLQGAASQNLGSKIPGLQKGFLETDEAQGKVDKQKVDLVDAKLKQSRQFLDGVTTPEQYIAWHEGNHSDPVLGPMLASRGVTADQARAQIAQALQTPGGFESLLKKSALGLEKFTELNKPSYHEQRTGDKTTLLATPGLGGAPTTVSSATINQSADNKASVGASMANAAATREVAKATRDAANIQTGFANEQGLRKEFEGLPEVKNYKQAYPAFAAIKDATGRNTTQSDINIVYGLAKLYDPTSVVREGEYATVANSPNIPEKVKGYAQYLAGGGRLSPETKKQILAEAQGRIGTYESEAKKAKTSYEGIAKKRGMEPSSVFAGMGDMVDGSSTKPNDGGKVVDFGSLK
jgi:hypothetical protein